MIRRLPHGRVNVLHLLPALGAGGVERMFAWMSARWSRNRFHVAAGILYGGERCYDAELSAAGMELLEIGRQRRGTVDLSLVRTLGRIVREREIDILHTHNVTAQVCAQACRLAGRLPLLVFHQHKSPTRLQRWVERAGRLLPPPDLRIAVSEDARRELIALGVAAPTIEVITNGIPLRPRTRPAATIDPAAPRLVAVTRLSEEKGVDHLIRAMRVLLERAPRAKLTIVGDGPDAAALRALSGAIGVGRVVEFAGFQADPSPFLESADVFALPSLQEGFGLALVEAMQAGLPCVATRAGGISEIVEDGVTGLLVAPADADALAEAVLRLVTSADLARSLAEHAAHAAQQYDIGRTVASIEAAYERLLERCA